MVYTRPLISKSSSLCANPLATVARTPITIGITVTFMFHSFCKSLARARYLSFISLSFTFTLWSSETAKSNNLASYLFFSWLLLGLVVWLRLGDPFVSQISKGDCTSYSPERILVCAYTMCSYLLLLLLSLLLLLLLPFWVFPSSELSWSFPGIWVTANLIWPCRTFKYSNQSLQFCCSGRHDSSSNFQFC